MVKREAKSFELVNDKLKLFVSYLDISIQSLQQYIIQKLIILNK